MDKGYSKLDPANFKKMIVDVVKEFPNLKVVATTLRNAKTASVNDWGAIIYTEGEFYEATLRSDLEIYDRVGGGDSFASALIYGLNAYADRQQSLEFAVAASCLKHSILGDFNRVTVPEVEKLMGGDASGRVQR